jgi:hypothetical protein
MSDDLKTCTRTGCGKRLRSDNTTGVCGSGCLSDEAPPAKRAKASKVAGPRKPKREASAAGDGEAVERFRTVATALGLDPEEILAEFAEAWIAELRGKVAA